MRKTANTLCIFVTIAIYIILNLSGANQCYGGNNTPPQYLHKEYESPSGDIIVKHFSDAPEDITNSEVWLYSAKNPSKKFRLYSYEVDATVIFSDDEKWLVLNHRSGSNEASAILFKKDTGLKYEIIIVLNELAWDLFRKTHKRYKIPDFFHSYTKAVLWSSDSKSILLEIYGHDDATPKELEPWYCIYDLKKEEMTL
ncbi:MAG: hypothetical protein L7F77_07595, partial [Candidatus Magnetominusculus sp. LBB02]|nr:hypothetical protein [Candidatus Magnetominusculus sp. LBB02]